MELCSVDACGRRIQNQMRSLCGGHYKQYLNGEAMRHIDRPAASFNEYFWANVTKGESCWMWNQAPDGHGYGHARYKGIRRYAHRASYEINVGRIPDGMLIDHKCHNPMCVNPAHLRLASKKTNAENFGAMLKNNKSGARGVYWHKDSNAYRVQVTHLGQRYEGGTHSNLEEAKEVARLLRCRLFTLNDRDRVPA